MNIALGALVAAAAAISLSWRIDFDTPLLLYVAHLIDRGYVPYRDVFDVNLPGTYLVNYLILKVFGHGDLSYRLADLSILALISLVTWSWMKRLGRSVAFSGVCLFALLYLGAGPLLTLQRDYLLLLPATAAMWMAVRLPRASRWSRAFVIGLTFGIGATIKPQALVGLPVAVAAALFMESDRESRGRAGWLFVAAFALAGLALPLLAATIYLWRAGALASFLDIARHYWPLFGEISGEQEVLPSFKAQIEYRFVGLIGYVSGMVILLPAGYGWWVASRSERLDPRQRRLVFSIGALAAAFAFYTFLAGRFWTYHWLPCSFFLALLVASGLVESGRGRTALLVVSLAALQIAAPLLPRLYFGVLGGAVNVPKGGRVDEIAGFLSRHLEPGDKVQPLDWTGGAVNAMLTARADLATRFFYTYVFYHHTSTPYIQGLRREFVDSLVRDQPRFIVELHVTPSIVHGPDTSREFAELGAVLKGRYRPVRAAGSYTIHELVETADASGSPP